jgi:hypothetical protein
MAMDKSNFSNHKTVFVLDHAPFFNYGCNNPHEFDFSKSRIPGVIPLAPIDKSLWTCCVEATLEYCRVVWDIYPSGKLVSFGRNNYVSYTVIGHTMYLYVSLYVQVSFIVSDFKAHRLNSWSIAQQNLNHVSVKSWVKKISLSCC